MTKLDRKRLVNEYETETEPFFFFYRHREKTFVRFLRSSVKPEQKKPLDFSIFPQHIDN